MGAIGKQTRSEFRQLPLMLGKFAGGLAAVLGGMVSVLGATRDIGGVAVPLLIAAAGIALFVVCNRVLAARPHSQPLASAERRRMNWLSWALLALLALAFLAGISLLGR